MTINKRRLNKRLCGNCKSLSLYLVLCLISSLAWNQIPDSVLLSSSLTENTTVEAKRFIKLLPGFNTNGFTFEAKTYRSINYAPVSYSIDYSLNHSTDENYIHTVSPRTEMAYIPSGERNSKDLTEEVSYYDGLGRLIQSIQIVSTPDGKDLCIPVEYDEFGRQVNDYLPFTKASNNGLYIDAALAEQASYYSSTNPVDVVQTNYPFSKTVFENSPLSRKMEQGFAGKYWQPYDVSIPESGHTIKYDYSTNFNNDIQKWTISGESCSKECYQDNELFVFISEDENGNITKEYKDKFGNVILKESLLGSLRIQTYYVYDDFGLLRYVLPPKFIQSHVQSGCTPETINRNDPGVLNYCYYYKYDSRKRFIEKQIPGGGTTYMVYNLRDLLVASQDSSQRQDNQWIFYKYDDLNRLIATGIITSSYSREDMQNLANTYNGFYLYERTYTYGYHNYTNRSFPDFLVTSESQYLTVTYYDNYDFISDLPGNTDFNYYQYSSEFEQTHRTSLTGNVTGSKVKVLGTSNWLSSVLYYNKYGNLIQTISDNNRGGWDRISNNYNNITGELDISLTQHDGGSGVVIDLLYEYFYDHNGMLVEVYNKIEDQEKVLLSANKFNEIGELVKNYQHGVGTGTRPVSQEVDYRYNSRGWLSKINDPTNLDDDLFALNLYYADVSSSPVSASATYNGNIASAHWNSSDGIYPKGEKAYYYTYDDLNRLTYAEFGEEGNWSSTKNEMYAAYDYNGNIINLNRSDGSGSTMDLLTYTYGNSNQIQSIAEAGNPDKGFIYNASAGNFTYDGNGNLENYEHKGISSISYNHLNLPETITSNSSTINYQYDALGNKLKKTYQADSSTITDYIGNFIYENDELQYILTEEGRILNFKNYYIYEYHLRDHLGNTRLTYEADEGGYDVTQISDYYPFGMRHTPVNPEHTNNYLYNGKELQDDYLGGTNLDWYDYGARFYDPALGRFHTQDAFAEKYYDLSPYQYAANNPIIFIDVNGDSVNVADLYSKNDQGEYVNSSQIKSFEVWASTDAGRQYILDHAQEGFELKGVYEKDLDIKAESAGKSHKKGIDVAFGTKALSSSGKTNRKIGEDDRLKLSFSMEAGFMSDSKQSLFSGVETWCHEVFVHGDHHEKKFLGQTPYSDYQNHTHTLPFESTKYYGVGIETLQQAQRILNISPVNTRDYIYFNVMLPNYNYNLKKRKDIKY